MPVMPNSDRSHFLDFLLVIVVSSTAVTHLRNQYILQLVSFLRMEALPRAVARLLPVADRYHISHQYFLKVIHAIISLAYKTYRLEVVQQPQGAAEFANYPLSRLPVTPPIIVRLSIQDASGNPVVPNYSEAELPFLIAHLSLYNDSGLEGVDRNPTQGGYSPASALYGNLVSSVEQLEDLQGNRGLFFLFPDVSIQWRGRYQLGITLLRISRTNPPHPIFYLARGEDVHIRDTITSMI
ncbi:velvet factor-domain-containing protein [Lentinula detonsa]|uniref:Velvet factor-domain-containing protein n=1 Tax=Lentinula detonsa TaxID=2804962 RepID=A0A9W8P249_9AGAR|nr:velvet factor-domain-containing protein [Lentinula detonsa]